MIISNTTAIPPKISIICNKHIGAWLKLYFGLWHHVDWLVVTDILEEHTVCIITAEHISVTGLMPQHEVPSINSSSTFTSNCFASPPPVYLTVLLSIHTPIHLTLMLAVITFASENNYGWFTHPWGGRSRIWSLKCHSRDLLLWYHYKKDKDRHHYIIQGAEEKLNTH